jgi:hypothetical protein
MRRVWATALAAVTVLAATPRVHAYSVLAHESNIDVLWDTGIRPLLAHRYPHATPEELRAARAYAYGGSVIQDLGYYPFGSHFFSNLLHYVRTGDVILAMLRDATSVNEYAFALGALAHYTSDNTGHPEAVNRSVPLLFPKLRAKYGDRVTYAQSPASHVVTEFSFDIVQVAAGGYAPDAYHRFIGFQVAMPVLERAFSDTYGLKVDEALPHEDLAVSTYRHAVSELIPELTRVAWRDKRDEIAKLTPSVKADAFIYRYSRADYERDFGADYRKPSLFMRILAFLYRLLPKIGPLRPLGFKAPTPEAERYFTESLADTRARYAEALAALRADALALPNTDFDTGQPSTYGEYSLADETYCELLHRLARRHFASVPDALRARIGAFYATLPAQDAGARRGERKRRARIRRELAALNPR